MGISAGRGKVMTADAQKAQMAKGISSIKSTPKPKLERVDPDEVFTTGREWNKPAE